jgi:hypothetical protein
MDKPAEKHMKAEQSELEVQMENRFYSEDNLSKLCAEGAVRNLMNMLHSLLLKSRIGLFLGNGYNECAKDTVCSERFA